MAKTQLEKNTTTGNWELTETNQPQHYTNTLLTAGLPIEGDIKIDITTQSGSVTQNAITITPTITESSGVVTVTGSGSSSPTVSAGYIDSVGDASASVSGSLTLTTSTWGTSKTGSKQGEDVTSNIGNGYKYVNITAGYTTAKYIRIAPVTLTEYDGNYTIASSSN